MSFMSRLAGSGIMARALRGSALTAGAYALSQGLRLASNLILARLLFPEAFGLMALVSVVLVGLQMFSDTGVGPSIAQHPRGDDPAFLNTAYTLNVGRGVLLWLMCCALALPLAAFYEAPMLTQLLPVAGLSLLLAGFNPTRIDTATRHLTLGRVTALDLASQVLGIAAMVVLAALTGSVWALVAGALVGALAKLVLTSAFLPGAANRLLWDRAAAGDLLRFGGWIFLSTACGFLLAQGDKAILGAHLTLERLGLYNIGFFLASFPILLAGAVTGRVMIPLYRALAEDPGRARRLRQMRWGLTLGTLSLLGAMALGGQALVGLLYDARYDAAGAVVVLVACAQMPAVVGMTYDQSALAAGRARSYFAVMALRAGLQTLAFVVGVQVAGLAGALAGQALAFVLAHGAIVWLARRNGVWDPRHDAAGLSLALALAALALAANPDLLARLPA